jgi:2-oxoisovalerate dehydrogenase E1 component
MVKIMKMEELKKIAENCSVNGVSDERIEEAFLIRAVEESFLRLFSEGAMNGTVHTCVGQEFSAVAVAGQLEEGDWVTSNHRCHGHFISKTKNWRGLIDELRGLSTGVCKGIGSSQHLFARGFLSNGPQGALLPVASGISQHLKNSGSNNIAISYIGEGTLGEGVVYETLNLDSLYDLPHLIVCENNLYSQSTPEKFGVSGLISGRPEAFAIKVFEGNTWNVGDLLIIAKKAIDYVRTGKPAFLIIRTYRLNAHSKGDDDRDQNEVEFFRKNDPLNALLLSDKWRAKYKKFQDLIDSHIQASKLSILSSRDYSIDQLPRRRSSRIKGLKNDRKRMVKALNEAYLSSLERGAFFIGEDISDPYGGAFKVTKGFSSKFPMMVKSTPISESGLVGIAIGMSMMGTISYAEIMFGDFMTHTLDQILSNASKFYHMYGFQISAPLRIRTPMGGKRGYGPTHSQSLEKFFVGIDNFAVFALSSLCDPAEIIRQTESYKCPMLILENKVDYGNFLWEETEFFEAFREGGDFGSIKISPRHRKPTLTLVSYGETARHLTDNLKKIFLEADLVPELICIIQLHPLDTTMIERSVKKTGKIVVVEDGSIDYGIGAEILSQLCERNVNMKTCLRIGAEGVPIPSIEGMEKEFLPTIERVIKKIKSKFI